MAKRTVSKERLHELLHYDEQTGVFTWKVRRGRVKAGAVAGELLSNGFISVTLDGVGHAAHRLAWLYVFGEYSRRIAHRNGVGCINALHNLYKPVSKASGLAAYRRGACLVPPPGAVPLTASQDGLVSLPTWGRGS